MSPHHELGLVDWMQVMISVKLPAAPQIQEEEKLGASHVQQSACKQSRHMISLLPRAYPHETLGQRAQEHEHESGSWENSGRDKLKRFRVKMVKPSLQHRV